MAFKFNPLTGLLDLVNTTVTISGVIQSILLDSTPDATYPIASILFDADSILYNDDEEL
jgi:hypothetical protein